MTSVSVRKTIGALVASFALQGCATVAAPSLNGLGGYGLEKGMPDSGSKEGGGKSPSAPKKEQPVPSPDSDSDELENLLDGVDCTKIKTKAGSYKCYQAERSLDDHEYARKIFG